MSFLRKRNTTQHGHNFPDAVIQAVWNKGRVVPTLSPDEWRYDSSNRLIRRADYGKTDSLYGWEIDHIYPVSKGGSDYLDNLQPLQWENNRQKGDFYPWLNSLQNFYKASDFL